MFKVKNLKTVDCDINEFMNEEELTDFLWKTATSNSPSLGLVTSKVNQKITPIIKEVNRLLQICLLLKGHETFTYCGFSIKNEW